MKHLFRKFILCSFAFLFLLSAEQKIFALTLVAPEDVTYTPTVLTTDVTDRTERLEVYVYDDTTLYIKNGAETIFQKEYKNTGRKKITIAAQKAETTLSVYLVAKSSGKCGKIVKLKVAKAPVIAAEPLDSSIANPVVPKTITTQTTSFSVYASKGTTLFIKNEKETVKKVKFDKTSSKKIRIPKQDAGNLYFYLKKGSSRSEIVSRTVLDKTAPKKPNVKCSIDGSMLTIKGEIGADVYIKIDNGKWEYLNTILDKDGIRMMLLGKVAEIEPVRYFVKLKDSSGNVSSVVKIDIPTPEISECPIWSDVPEMN